MVMVFAFVDVIVVDVEHPGGCVFMKWMLYEGGCMVTSVWADVSRKHAVNTDYEMNKFVWDREERRSKYVE